MSYFPLTHGWKSSWLNVISEDFPDLGMSEMRKMPFFLILPFFKVINLCWFFYLDLYLRVEILPQAALKFQILTRVRILLLKRK